MHEFSLAIEVINLAQREAEKNLAESIQEITIEVGDLSGVEADAFESALELLVKESILENADINIIISNSETESVGKDNSAVYFTIAKELNRLSHSKTTTKLMLVYSDLMENTPGMSFYDSDTFTKIKSAPNTIQHYFESQQKLTNLNGIKVYLIYQPENTKQDEDYKVVSGFYKNWLESKGAIVEISANLN